MTRLRLLGLLVLALVFVTAAACPVTPRTPLHSHALNPAPSEISVIGQGIVDLVNEQRVAAGCEELIVDGSMVTFADQHARWMDNGGGFVHSRLGAPILAENLSQGLTAPDDVVAAWLDSDVHRKNMFDCSYTHTGAGISGDFAVQVYGDAS